MQDVMMKGEKKIIEELKWAKNIFVGDYDQNGLFIFLFFYFFCGKSLSVCFCVLEGGGTDRPGHGIEEDL